MLIRICQVQEMYELEYFFLLTLVWVWPINWYINPLFYTCTYCDLTLLYILIFITQDLFFIHNQIFLYLHYLKLISVKNKWREFKKSFCFILFHKMICKTKVNAKTFLQWKWFLKWWSFINEFRCLQFEKNLMAVW